MPVLVWFAWFAAGWFTWTLAEYVLHRFGMHALRGKGIASREHLNHHAGIIAPWTTDALSWVGVLVLGAGFGTWVAPLHGAGWVFGYGFYYLHHYFSHRRAPSGPYTRWLRRHHFHHHFGHPNVNHGVTWSLWDHVFGTYEAPPERVKVPRRMAVTLVPWMDERFESEYEVVGRRRELDETDLHDAYANRPPVLT